VDASWTLSLLAAGLTGLAALTWAHPPTPPAWKLAILVGEFGHFLAVLSGALALGLLTTGDAMDWERGVTLALLLVATFLLLRPAWLAWRISLRLPARLRDVWGEAELPARRPLLWARLFWPRRLRRVPVETLAVPRPEDGGAVGGAAVLPLDFHRAIGTRPGGCGAAPCIVVIHGGGWDGGDRRQLAAANHRLAAQGYAVAAISYRLAPRHPWPAAAEDVVAAVAFLRSRAAELGIDPDRVVLFGRSAGGQLATAVGYRPGQPFIRGVVAYYAPHDLHFAWRNTPEGGILDFFALMRRYLGGSPDEVPRAYDEASAYHAVTPQVPPTLLVHGGKDSLVWFRQSERLDARLAEARVPHTYLALPWAVHAFDFNPDGPGGQLADYALETFLAAVTAGGRERASERAAG
jgi:acetyl esterase/lipase